MSIQIGKSKIEISVKGCTRCGTLWSRAWWVVREIIILVGKRTLRIEIHICDDCRNETEQSKDKDVL